MDRRLVWRTVAFAVMVLGTGTPASRGEQDPADLGAQVIEVYAERFTFTPSEIHVKAGTVVELRIRSADTNHGFHILGSEVDLLVPKRGQGVATVRFRADESARFVFECSKLCGAGHSFMRGEIIVTE